MLLELGDQFEPNFNIVTYIIANYVTIFGCPGHNKDGFELLSNGTVHASIMIRSVLCVLWFALCHATDVAFAVADTRGLQ